MMRRLPLQFTHVVVTLCMLFVGQQAAAQTTDGYDRSKFDPVQVRQGRQLYLRSCTVCHGINAEGSPDWRQADAQGRYPAPPLNGSGHAWHHPMSVLMDTIRHGTLRLGGRMPPWKDRLSDEQIRAIILWLQTQWPDELYEAWVRRDKQRSQR